MLPDDLPDNVIPLRPRQTAKRVDHATASKTAAASGATPIKLSTLRPGARPGARSDGEAIAAANLPLVDSSRTEPSRASVIQDMTSNAARQQLAVKLAPDETGGEMTGETMGETTAAMSNTPSQTQPARQFSWRHFLWVIAGAFVLGVAFGWGTIALAAHVLGVWPHGFALYAMIIGSGLTLALTAALMSAVFYSDSSGHDESVYHYQQKGPRARDRGEPE